METYDCLLGTHIDPGWSGPDVFQDNLERYVDEDRFDRLVTASVTAKEDATDRWDNVADEVLPSPDGQLKDDAVEFLLENFDSFVHVGAYWDKCHGRTWEDLTAGMSEQEDAGEYTVAFPLDCVLDRTFTAYWADDTYALLDEYSGEELAEKVEQYVQRLPENLREEGELEYRLRGERPVLEWRL